MALACKVHTRYEAVVGTDEACLHHSEIYRDIFVNIIAYKRLHKLIVETGHTPTKLQEDYREGANWFEHWVEIQLKVLSDHVPNYFTDKIYKSILFTKIYSPHVKAGAPETRDFEHTILRLILRS